MALSWNVLKFTVVNPATVKANANVTDWDAYATTTSGYTSEFTVSMTVNQTNLQSMFGLASNQAPSFPVYSQMPICLYLAANGTLYQFDGGNMGQNFGSYSVGDVLSIRYSGTTVTYKKNATTLLTRTRAQSGLLYMCCTAGIANAQFNNLTFSPILSVPNAPTISSVTADNSQVSVAFSTPANNGSPILDYTVTSNPGGFTATGTSSPLTVTGLTNGTAYTFTVTARNVSGSSAASSASSSVTPRTVPGAPSGVSASASNGQAVVSFVAPASNGGSPITGYTVTSSPGEFTAAGASSPLTVTGLTNGTSYTFTVVATNVAGTSAASSASSSVTPIVTAIATAITQGTLSSYISAQPAKENKKVYLDEASLDKEIVYYHMSLPNYETDTLIANGQVTECLNDGKYVESYEWNSEAHGYIRKLKPVA